ncbi:MAG: diguanylate cyclase [Pseudomonadota bacterium]
MDFPASLNLVVISAAVSVVFFFAWRNLGRKQPTFSWFVASSAGLVAAVLSVAPSTLHGPGAALLAVSCVVAASFYLQGHGHRTACRPLVVGAYPALVVVAALVGGLTMTADGARFASPLLTAYCAIAFLLSATLTVRRPRPTRPDEWLSFCLMLAVGGLFLAHAAATALPVLPRVPGLPLAAGALAVAIVTALTVASDMSDELHELATNDQLTGLLNRRGFGERAAAAYAHARQCDGSVSVIMSDIDRFKQINDAFGHAAGDLALKHFALALIQDLDRHGFAARVGGEEFALVLPSLTLEQALNTAEALCDRIETTPLVVDGSEVPMTASFGVATLTKKDTCLTDVILRADRALYRSKRDGRNRVDLESSQVLKVLRTYRSEAAVKEA